MLIGEAATQPARTLLERLIRERRQTYEEFTEYAERFARDHDEPGTLSVRHLQRLAAGRRPDGAPLGPLRPATARLLERIFDVGIGELLAPPLARQAHGDSDSGVRQMPTAHVLRVAIAIVARESEVLIVRRRGEDGRGISWQFPAGMVKPDVPSETVAIQETLAETGVHCVMVRRIGSRLHPITNVFCEYMLCDYLAGDATNSDVVENSGVVWADKTKLIRFIPADQIYRPVLEALEVPNYRATNNVTSSDEPARRTSIS